MSTSKSFMFFWTQGIWLTKRFLTFRHRCMTITNHTFWITLVCGKDDVFNEITYVHFKRPQSFLMESQQNYIKDFIHGYNVHRNRKRLSNWEFLNIVWMVINLPIRLLTTFKYGFWCSKRLYSKGNSHIYTSVLKFVFLKSKT